MNDPRAVAGILRRFMALIYDLLLLLGISFAYGAIVLLVRKLFGADTMEPAKGFAGFVILTGLCLSYGAFFSWCWLRSGQTLGMQSWRIQLENVDANPITWQTCVRRCLIAPLAIASGGIGFLWCLVNREGDALQDKLTHTRVYLLPKEK